MSSRSILLALFAMAMPLVATANTDVVVFDNGDRLTGEIKSLERGKLRFKTEATDTISIEWDDVAFLSSDQNIQVETYDGRRYLGHLKLSPALKTINVELGEDYLALDATHIVLMTPIEEHGLDRFAGDVTAGYNFTKADAVEQFQFGLEMEYRTELRSFGLTVDSSTSNTDVDSVDPAEDTSSQRHSVNLDYKRFWPNRWLVSGFLNADRNDELKIDLRTSLGGGGGRIVRQTNHSKLLLESGLMLSHENLAPPVPGGVDPEDKDTVEAYVSFDWDWYRFDSPELDLSSSLEIIPNLTESGRVRGEFDISLKWEIVHDLFWEVSYYESYDSDPSVIGAEKNDFGIVTSIGYDF
jgi:hypothetical protein